MIFNSDKNKLITSILLLFFLLPLLYINVKTTHDWGDDFAQYIVQAKSMVSKTNFVSQVAGLTNYSPSYRPAGFPLLLVPFYYFFGNSTYVFLLFISSLLILLSMVFFRFLCHYFNVVVSFLLTLVFVYNPAVLALKSEIMAEIPLTLFLVAGIWVYTGKNKNYLLFTLIIATLLIFIKSIGVVFIMAVAVDLVVQYIINRHREEQSFYFKNIGRIVLYCSLPFVIYFTANYFIFNIPFGSEGWYSKLVSLSDLAGTVQRNFILYKDLYFISFEQEVPNYINVFVKSCILVFLLIGMVVKLKRKVEMYDYLVFLYLAVIITYQYSHGGYRFLFPVIPFLLFYTFTGVQVFITRLQIKSIVPVCSFLLLILGSYTVNTKAIIKETPLMQWGPEDSDFSECVNFIKRTTTSEDCFLFVKPWAFNLYTERKVVPLSGNDNVVSFKKCIEINKVNYIVACTNPNYELYDLNLLHLVSVQKSFKEVWKNEIYTIYKR